MSNRDLALVAVTLWWHETSSTELDVSLSAGAATTDTLVARAWLRTTVLEQRRYEACNRLLDRIDTLESTENPDEQEQH